MNADNVMASLTDPVSIALLPIKIVFADRDVDAQKEVERALFAAAIPHRFDAALLARLLDRDDASALWTDLCELPSVRVVAGSDPIAASVHDAVRPLLRRRLHETDPDRFQRLASVCVEAVGSGSVAARIEAAYHQLHSAPMRGVRAAFDLDREMVESGNDGGRSQLSQVAGELLAETWLHASARAAALVLSRAYPNAAPTNEAGGTVPWATAQEARQRLALLHAPLVRSIARRIHRRLPRSIDLEDLFHVGFVGLLQAIDRHQANDSVPLRLFARQRITGAILDFLRDLDWVPRIVRRRAEILRRARQVLVEQLGRSPTQEELAAKLRMPIRRLACMEQTSVILLECPIDGPADPTSGIPLAETLVFEGGRFDSLEQSELRDAIVEAITRLPPGERQAVQGFYLETRPLRDIATALGVSESRASQLRRDGVKRLRYQLRDHLADT